MLKRYNSSSNEERPMLKIKTVSLGDVSAVVKALGATTMSFKVDGQKFVMSATFLTQTHLDSFDTIRFYGRDSRCVAKWVK